MEVRNREVIMFVAPGQQVAAGLPSISYHWDFNADAYSIFEMFIIVIVGKSKMMQGLTTIIYNVYPNWKNGLIIYLQYFVEICVF